MPSQKAVLAFAVFLLAPTVALGAHGKAGLWSSSTTMTIPGIAPQTHATTYCMTPAQVASDDPIGQRNPNCTYSNVHVDGHAYSADMVCKGQFEATGHFSASYDSDTHYIANATVATNGMTMTNRIEGSWVKTDCTGAEH